MNKIDVGALAPLQSARRLALTALVVLMTGVFAFIAAWTNQPVVHEAVEAAGLVAILLCIVGRCWCTLYIGGRKGRQLVDTGPYSLSRNPLYLFSTIGALGFGAQTGSLAIAAACGGLTWLVFRFVVAKEEAFLDQALGEPYAVYRLTTPRFLPKVRLWKSPDLVEIRPRRVVATFADGLLFLLAIPLAEGLEQLQAMGAIPIVFDLM